MSYEDRRLFAGDLPRLELVAERAQEASAYASDLELYVQAMVFVWHERCGIDVEHVDTTGEPN